MKVARPVLDWRWGERSPHRPYEVDFFFFGWVHADFSEMGYFALSEMEAINVGGLGMERDLHFTQKRLSEVKKEHQ